MADDTTFQSIILSKLDKMDSKQDNIVNVISTLDKGYGELSVLVKNLAETMDDHKKYLEERIKRNEVENQKNQDKDEKREEDTKKKDNILDKRISNIEKSQNRIYGGFGLLTIIGSLVGIFKYFF